jgi:hypothetical protein
MPEATGNYIWYLDRIQRRLLPRTYLEIGVCRGRSLALALPGSKAIGVDPNPRICHAIGPAARVFPMTSDAFFDHHAADLFGNEPIDLAFIDGLHLAEAALRDFANVERWAQPGSVVLMHDLYPIDEASASREQQTVLWSGDVWKAALALRTFRPDLSVTTLAVRPTGLGIVTGLDPASTVLFDRYDEIVRWMDALDYADLMTDKDGQLNAIPADPHALGGLLPPPFRVANSGSLVRRRALRMPPTLAELGKEGIRRAKLSGLAPTVERLRRAV